MSHLEVRLFPCLSDNYGVLIHDPVTGVTASIDAPDDDAVRTELESAGWTLTHILVTHHHWDHIQGLQALKRDTNCTVYAPAREAAEIPVLDVEVHQDDRVPFGRFEVEVIETPGHTPGHVAYFIPDAIQAEIAGQKSGLAFVGDTLFSVGCGRVNDGRYSDMWHSLEKLMRLPERTLLYVGHEYTQSNIKFALSVEPENIALHKRKEEVDRLRADGKPTLPVTLAKELETNPFLRPFSPEIRKSLGIGPDVSDESVFEELRRRKDRF